MKLKRLMLVTLVLLAVLTIGAVSAAEDTTSQDVVYEDSLAVNDEGVGTEETPLSEADSQDDVIASPYDENGFDEILVDEINITSDDTVVDINTPDNGTFSITVSPSEDPSEGYNIDHQVNDADVEKKYIEWNLNDLKIENEGTYFLSAKFIFPTNEESVIFENHQLTVTGDGGGEESEYYIFINEEELPLDNYGDYDALGGVILPNDTAEGHFDLWRGDDVLFNVVVGQEDSDWHNDEEGRLKCHVYLRDLNLSEINDGDELKFVFYNANDEEVYCEHCRVHVTESTIQCYFEDGEGDDDRIEETNTETAFDSEEDVPVEISENAVVLYILVPQSELENANQIVKIYKNDELISTQNISDIEAEYVENREGYRYPITLDLTQFEDKDLVRFEFEGDYEDDWTNVVHIDEGNAFFYWHEEGFYFYAFYGNITTGDINDPEAMGPHPNGNFMNLDIPDSYNVNDGTITVSDGESELFTKQLSQCSREYDYGILGYVYSISLDDINLMDFPEGSVVTITFSSENLTKYEKRIRINDFIFIINTPERIADYVAIDAVEEVTAKSDNVVSFIATDLLNPMSVWIDAGSGFFNVYVNGVKVDDLGLFFYVEPEEPDEGDEPEEQSVYYNELEFAYICDYRYDGLYLNLNHLGITENGQYNIRIAHYAGDFDVNNPGDSYFYCEEVEVLNKNFTVNIEKINSSVVLGDDIVFDYGKSGSTNVIYNNATGVTASVINNTNAVVTIADGIITVSNLPAGKYNLKVTTVPKDNYNAVSAITNITVNKLTTKITSAKVTTTYATSKNIVVTLKDVNGKVLSNKKVTVVLNGVSKTLTTKSNGQISLAVGTKLVPKTYKVSFTFNGDSNYVKSTGSTNVVVKKATPKLTAKKKTFTKIRSVKKYTIVLKTNKNKAMKKVKLILKVKGKKYIANTNNAGKATFKITKLTKIGTFKAKITYKGNNCYNKVSKTVKITVKK